ncbi:FecCD family ABC transporter permease [Methanocella arvoryzae]|uniref:Cobalamin import system permease protein BtuC n=1 Tax=Methanocella arvoryzae (strain DSM 22066 / NBRC 105507 / MRE50) TaxID=351160 RepID=Q0W0R1_METAR|nr:iron chelate uptake ABC transporter family permease subunit [Methanocella arvoryzae]CAJ38032.1 putative ABC-type transport system, permease component [Methanocella arvoryzae MRE50]
MEVSVTRWAGISLVLFIVMILIAVVATAVGPANISPDKVVMIILSKVPVVQDYLTKVWTVGEEAIVINVRLPRVILGLLVGASLAVAGVTTQGIFKNPMADPYILGVSSGAAFGASAVIVLGVSVFLQSISITAGALAGALIVSFLVFNIARTRNRIPVETLLLSGIAVSAFFSAITSFLMYISGNSLNQIVFWVMGALWSSNWDDVLILAPFFVAGSLIVYAYSRDLNLMLLGDESAAHLGSDVTRVKYILLGVSSLMAAAAVSVTGIIGFVGLIIPHIMRLIVGPDHRVLIPASALVGAIFLVLADTFARMVIQPTEMPVGIVTALIGAPFFVYLLIRQKKTLRGV